MTSEPFWMNRSETLLFRWIGKGIEGSTLARSRARLPVLRHEHRAKYLEYLEDALSEDRGLYAKIPTNDFLGTGTCLRLNRPCICFTELRLGEATAHWREYGRMALGFSKSVVVNWGGKPVAYINGSSRDPAVRRLELLHRHFSAMPETEPSRDRFNEAFEYLWHFFKRMRYASSPRGKATVAGGKYRAKAVVPKRRSRVEIDGEELKARQAAFPKCRPLPYLNEHEWRLAYSADLPRWRPITTNASVETAWFNIKIGRELVAVVLPDNLTVQYALETASIRKRLIGKGRPPVQLLSLEAVMRL